MKRRTLAFPDFENELPTSDFLEGVLPEEPLVFWLSLNAAKSKINVSKAAVIECSIGLETFEARRSKV